MKKKLAIAIGFSALVLSVTIVSCTKKQTTPSQTNVTTNMQPSSQAGNSARPIQDIPTDPGTPPNPNEMIDWGYTWCIELSLQGTNFSGPCNEDFGIICGWNVVQCNDGVNISTARLAIPNIDNLTTGVIYVEVTSFSTKDLTGQPVIVANNMTMNADFCKQLNCDQAYLLKCQYKYLKGNVVMLPMYIVNHRK